ncbi:MAG: iron-containing alcohol dehydrogenase, partial [Desulforhopalus sp.]|nr:iron-containing alcohol dehydrogenase [Desulforhopalus sp.]
MITPFSLKTPSRIVFGAGCLKGLADAISGYGRRPLLVLGGKSFAASDHFAKMTSSLQHLGLTWQTTQISSEPSPGLIDQAVLAATDAGIDLVVAIGGGAAVDAGKAISAMLIEGGPVSRFLEGVGTTRPSGRKLPFIAVPTTAGTGSEATANAVLSEVGQRGFKKSLRHDRYLPDLALIDPLLTLSCPPRLTIACAMDCFTQLVEGYLSTKASAPTDALALEGLQAVARSLQAVCLDGGNLSARSDLAYAALLSGIVLANAGLGTVHGLAGTIGGLAAIPHGVICGSLMAPANRLTLARLRKTGGNHPALGKYSILGKIFSGTERAADQWYQDFFIAELERLSTGLQIPPLSAYGLGKDDIPRIIAASDNKNNPLPLTEEELTSLLATR